MKDIKKETGITLIALIVTIVVLLIIIGVSIGGGTYLLNTSKAETIETNMLTIKAKAKAYMENVDSKNWASKDDNNDSNYGGLSTKEGKNRKELVDKYKLNLINDFSLYPNNSSWKEDGYTYYEVGADALNKMNLNNINESYIIRYPLEDGDITGLEIDIIYANGVEYKEVIYYKLSDLENVL